MVCFCVNFRKNRNKKKQSSQPPHRRRTRPLLTNLSSKAPNISAYSSHSSSNSSNSFTPSLILPQKQTFDLKSFLSQASTGPEAIRAPGD